MIIEPRREKTGLRGFRPGPTQTGLYKHRRSPEACNFGFNKRRHTRGRDCTIRVAKTKASISFAVTGYKFRSLTWLRRKFLVHVFASVGQYVCLRDCTIRVAKTKASISFAVTGYKFRSLTWLRRKFLVHVFASWTICLFVFIKSKNVFSALSPVKSVIDVPVKVVCLHYATVYCGCLSIVLVAFCFD